MMTFLLRRMSPLLMLWTAPTLRHQKCHGKRNLNGSAVLVELRRTRWVN
jgi:hypothetical protein